MDITYKKEKTARLDHFMCKKMPELSRSKLQKLIEAGQILVNQMQKKPHYKLKTNDQINILSTELVPQAKERSKQKPIPKNYDIVSDDINYLIINKPAGIAVHKSGAERTSLIDLVIKDYPKIIKVGEDPMRPGVVHRLDKDVSGLLVIAKTQSAFDDLKKQFKKRQIKKSYQALVYGTIHKEEDTIKFPITRATSGHKMAALPISEETNERGKIAITSFKTIKEYINYSLLRINTKTGRTHQIRAHMAAYGHPIVGDKIYGTRKTNEMNAKIDINRIFLVADKLGFKNLEDTQISFEIELNKELKDILEIIK